MIQAELTHPVGTVMLYRAKYGIPANDPRLRGLPLEVMELDLELPLHVRDVDPLQCDGCGGWFYIDYCTVCPGTPSLRSEVGRLADREAAGEQVTFEEYVAAVFKGKEVSA